MESSFRGSILRQPSYPCSSRSCRLCIMGNAVTLEDEMVCAVVTKMERTHRQRHLQILSCVPHCLRQTMGNRGAQVRSTPEFTSPKEGGDPSKDPPASVTHAEMPVLCQAGLRCSMLIPLSSCATLSNHSVLSLNVGAGESNPVPRCLFYSRGALWNLPPL